MVSYLYFLPFAGMIAVGVIAIVYWHLKTRVRLQYYVYGGVLWAVAIGIKIAMDYTITRPLNNGLLSVLPFLAVLFLMSLYLGLRTGIFENVITYLGVKYAGQSSINFNQAIALGIGFGSTEAILLGIYYAYDTYMQLQLLDTLTLLPPLTISQDWLIGVLTPACERLFTLFCHVFTTVLVVYSVKLKDLRWLGVAAVFKTLLDGSILPLTYFLGLSAGLPYMTFSNSSFLSSLWA